MNILSTSTTSNIQRSKLNQILYFNARLSSISAEIGLKLERPVKSNLSFVKLNQFEEFMETLLPEGRIVPDKGQRATRTSSSSRTDTKVSGISIKLILILKILESPEIKYRKSENFQQCIVNIHL